MKKGKTKGVKVSNLALICAFLFFVILVARLTHLSLSKTVDGVDLQSFAKTRTTKKAEIPANRGNIYDANIIGRGKDDERKNGSSFNE